ncbi:hypothetical protein GCM10017673_57900 [Streptosporangium violaceochromogenes]|nr:hypothetical protein GCM10017673_57900 [Streptosporangium violaceochromogenes]
MTPVAADRARALLVRVLAPYPDDRAAVAEALVAAHLRGHPEFGLPLLDRELAGPGAACAAPVLRGAGAARTLDARGVPGPVAMAAAVRHAGNVAVDLGVGLVAARSVTGTGRLAPYAAAQARSGRVALLLAHAPRAVAPHGGHTPVLGTNPIAYALPRAGGRVLAADFTTAAMTQAELGRRRAAGEGLPAGAAVGRDGGAVTDPGAVGALLPAGGLLGTLAGLLVESLAGALLGQRDGASGRGVVALVVDPGFLGAEEPAGRIEALCREIAAAGGRVPGAAGEPAAGGVIDVDDDVWLRLREHARCG